MTENNDVLNDRNGPRVDSFKQFKSLKPFKTL